MAAVEPVTRGKSVIPGVVLGVVAVLFLLVSWGRISAHFGDSDEGINGAVWAADSKALLDAGIVDSRLGGVGLHGTKYATHPPLIVIETAASEVFAGARGWTTRAPAWLGSLVSLVVLYFLIRSLETSPTVAATAVAATALTPMFFTYGLMLDTPVTSFPFGVAVLLLWYARWKAPPGSRAHHPVLVAGVATLAALSGWQATVLVAMCTIALLARIRRGWRVALTEALPFGIGGLVGLCLSLSWVYWVYGDFHVLLDKYGGRTGGTSHVGLGDMVSFQTPWLAQLLALGAIGLAACVVALWSPRFRPVAAMSLASVGVYAILFRQAAAGHQYWNYWALLPVCVGFAYAFRRVERDIGQLAPAVLVGCVAFLGVFNLVFAPHKARDLIDHGHAVVDELLAAPYVERATGFPGVGIHYIGQPYRADSYVDYYRQQLPQVVSSSTQLRQLAASNPDDLVLVLGSCTDAGDAKPFCEQVIREEGVGDAGDGRGEVVTASALARKLGLDDH